MIPRGCDADGGQAKVGLSRHLARLKQSGGWKAPKTPASKAFQGGPVSRPLGSLGGAALQRREGIAGPGPEPGPGPSLFPWR